jgi:hypothetical protein
MKLQPVSPGHSSCPRPTASEPRCDSQSRHPAAAQTCTSGAQGLMLKPIRTGVARSRGQHQLTALKSPHKKMHQVKRLWCKVCTFTKRADVGTHIDKSRKTLLSIDL